MIFAGNLWPWRFQIAWVLALLLLIPLRDTRGISAQAAYDRAHMLFLHGALKESQSESEQGYKRYLRSNPEWAAKFQLLQARAMVGRGMDDDALRVLSVQPTVLNTREEIIEKFTLEGVAFAYLHQFALASQRLDEAQDLCAAAYSAACDGVPIRRGILANRRGQPAEAGQFFLEGLHLARAHHDPWQETTALLNLGYVSLQTEHYDEAVEWSGSAYRSAMELDAQDQAQNALGNLGWAYFKLGDKERALQLFLEAQNRAEKIGDVRLDLKWVSNAGYVYQDSGDLTRAIQAYGQSLQLARQINSNDDIVNALEDLAHASIDAGKLDEASAYIGQVNPLVSSSGNHLDALDVMLAQARIAAARRQDQQAEAIFRAVAHDPASQISMRLGSEHQLARLYELQGRTDLAGRMYKTALSTFESARADLQNENSKLPFLANATSIYDDYIHFLVTQGRPEEALLAADQSRARTLAQGLGLVTSKQAFRPPTFSPRAVAQKTGAAMLFYWLGEQQSYLWTITPERIALSVLPAQKEIAPLVERYSATLLGPEDPIQAGDEEGQTLFRLLVAPALKLVRTGTPIAILADGPLTRLNFETLLAPGPGPAPLDGQSAGHAPLIHYWIDDVTLFSAPSLSTLAAAKSGHPIAQNLLLIGDPVSPNSDFPTLPLFGLEMKQIEKTFSAQKAMVFAGQHASPAAYLSSNPGQYSYIHFVAHATASRTDPLDSAIILSSTSAGEDSFKLYAREIMQRPIDARLVTISACYGTGTRFYAGEGLVGLSWAFLRAGAHSVVGALWEVSDESTPRLMESLYQGIKQGHSPAVALRDAKVALLHSKSKFRSPFYWAPFQLYSRF